MPNPLQHTLYDANVTAGRTLTTDLSPDDLLRHMDKHGVHKAILGPIEPWYAVDNQLGNTTIADWVRRWPDRFWGYATANPWYGQRATDEINRALDDGLTALKFHPGRQGFVILEPCFVPLLEIAAQRKLIMYIVTGIHVDSMPLQLVELALRYPTIPFIVGRSGRGDFGLIDLLPGVQMAPNLYIETVYNFPDGLNPLLSLIGHQRILFASDSPATNLRMEIAKLQHLEVDDEALGAILGGNLLRLLNAQELNTKATEHARP